MNRSETEEVEILLKSNKSLILEKLQVLSEELIFLYKICSFYSHKENYNDDINDLKHNFVILKNSIKFLHESIESIYEELQSIKIKGQDLLKYIYMFDYSSKRINKIIQEFKLINEKISQLFRDGYNQYIPKPIIGRIYSNINITSQMESLLKKKIEKLMKDNQSIKILIIWQFSDSYQIDLFKNKNSLYLYINMSYWYFDLPYLIPALTHEIGHLALEDERNKEYLNKLVNKIHQKKIKPPAELEEYHDFESFLNNICVEILADILALLHHGTSYILTLTHSFIGFKLSNSFNMTYLDKNREKIIEIAQWRFNEQRDNNFIRLWILIRLIDEFKKFDNKEVFSCCKEYVKATKEILDFLYGNKSTLEQYFEYWHNSLFTFKAIKKYVLAVSKNLYSILKEKEFFNWFKEIYSKNDTYTKQNDLKNAPNNNTIYKREINVIAQDFTIPKTYNDIWKERLEKIRNSKNKIQIPHKNILRLKIHYDTINSLINQNMLDPKSLKPYSLTFYKKRRGTSSLLDSKSKNNNIENTLGIYDEAIIEKQKEFYSPTINKIDETNNHFYLKFNLIKILKDITTDKSKNDYLNVIIQIGIQKNIQNTNIYQDLTRDLVKLYNLFRKEQEKNIFKKISFFKSLGPKDILIKIDDISIENIFKIKNKLQTIFNRTFTTISYKPINISHIKSKNHYPLITKLRLKSTSNIEQLLKFILEPISINYIKNRLINLPLGKLKWFDKYNQYIKKKNYLHYIWKQSNLYIPFSLPSNIKKLHYTPGIMDVSIYWENDTSMKEIKSFCKKLCEHQILSDSQTTFNEILINKN